MTDYNGVNVLGDGPLRRTVLRSVMISYYDWVLREVPGRERQ